MDRLIKSRIAHDNGDVQYTMADGAVVTMNKHGDGFWRRVLDKLWEYEQGELARNLHDVASNQQITEPLSHKGFRDFSEELETKNQVKGIRMMSRPWQPQDLLDDLQLIIDEESDHYLNDRRTTLCMARDFLKEHFTEPDWISVDERLPKPFVSVLVQMPGEKPFPTVREGFITSEGIWHSAFFDREPGEVTHWREMPEPPEEG